MKCGVGVIFLNSVDLERVTAEDWTRPPSVPDHSIWDDSLALGDLIEPLGFDSIWSSEHLASPYGMCPNALMHLAYWAGRTERVDLGTMVVVAPWHNPVQLAHEIAMLDILLQGRRYTVGLGRGLSPKEFRAVGVPQDESRQRFAEAAEIVRLALTSERFSFDGDIYKIPEMSLRPQPRHRNLMDSAVAAFMTPSSLETVARLGLGHIVVTSQSFDKVGDDTTLFNQIRSDAGLPPTRPILYLWGHCVEREGDIEQVIGPMLTLGQAGSYHYEFDKLSSLTNISGYEQYGELLSPENQGAPVDPFGTHLVGTPDQIIVKVKELQAKTLANEIVVQFNFGGSLARDDAERSMRLFAQEVLPAIHELDDIPLEAESYPSSL